LSGQRRRASASPASRSFAGGVCRLPCPNSGHVVPPPCWPCWSGNAGHPARHPGRVELAVRAEEEVRRQGRSQRADLLGGEPSAGGGADLRGDERGQQRAAAFLLAGGPGLGRGALEVGPARGLQLVGQGGLAAELVQVRRGRRAGLSVAGQPFGDDPIEVGLRRDRGEPSAAALVGLAAAGRVAAAPAGCGVGQHQAAEQGQQHHQVQVTHRGCSSVGPSAPALSAAVAHPRRAVPGESGGGGGAGRIGPAGWLVGATVDP
jgi:hypothetical protein